MKVQDTDLLTPGSVWTRNKSGNESLVLFVTNEAVPIKKLEEFPQIVVYQDEKKRTFSRNIEQFLDSHTFYNVNPNAESIVQVFLDTVNEPDADSEVFLANLTNEDSEDDDDGGLIIKPNSRTEQALIDIQSGADSEADAENDGSEDQGETEDSASILGQAFTFTNSDGEKATVSPDYLVENLVGYTTEPNLLDGSTIHRITFAANESVRDLLLAAFDPAQTGFFDVVTFGGNNIEWQQSAGVHPTYEANGTVYMTVILLSNIPVLDNEAVDEAVDQPETQGESLTQASIHQFPIRSQDATANSTQQPEGGEQPSDNAAEEPQAQTNQLQVN